MKNKRTHTDEAKRKISIANSGENNGFFGKHHTEEAKKKISDARKRMGFSETHLKNLAIAGIKRRGISSGMKGKVVWNRGIPMSEEAKEKQRIAHSGSNNANWIDGRGSGEYPYFFKKLRKKIYNRDNYICQLCGIKFNKKELRDKNFITAHHIDYDKKNCNESNLISLCTVCNSSVNKNRITWLEFFKNKIVEKYSSDT